jgi:hypothetical protein
MVKSSKTDNENASYMASYRVAIAGEVHSCSNPNYNMCGGNGNLYAWHTIKKETWNPRVI